LGDRGGQRDQREQDHGREEGEVDADDREPAIERQAGTGGGNQRVERRGQQDGQEDEQQDPDGRLCEHEQPDHHRGTQRQPGPTDRPAHQLDPHASPPRTPRGGRTSAPAHGHAGGTARSVARHR
jgi:hypothetical protein